MAGEGCQHCHKWGPQPILAAAARAPAPCATPRLSSSPLAEDRPRARVMTQFVQGAGSAVLARCWHPASHYYDISLTRHCSLQPPLWPARQHNCRVRSFQNMSPYSQNPICRNSTKLIQQKNRERASPEDLCFHSIAMMWSMCAVIS